jgi:hypothetical protein
MSDIFSMVLIAGVIFAVLPIVFMLVVDWRLSKIHNELKKLNDGKEARHETWA